MRITQTLACWPVRPQALARTPAHTLNPDPDLDSSPTQVDLPPLLGVDLVHCEREAGAAVAAARGAMRLVQGGELVTDAYFEGVAAEIDETLQVHWCCSSTTLLHVRAKCR